MSNIHTKIDYDVVDYFAVDDTILAKMQRRLVMGVADNLRAKGELSVEKDKNTGQSTGRHAIDERLLLLALDMFTNQNATVIYRTSLLDQVMLTTAMEVLLHFNNLYHPLGADFSPNPAFYDIPSVTCWVEMTLEQFEEDVLPSFVYRTDVDQHGTPFTRKWSDVFDGKKQISLDGTKLRFAVSADIDNQSNPNIYQVRTLRDAGYKVMLPIDVHMTNSEYTTDE
jgi:hypothetical protein